MTKTNTHVLIMAGGVGSRFWPMSTDDTPKQFIDVLGTGRTLIQMTFDRFADICDINNFYVATNKIYKEEVHRQLPSIPVENILTEPCRRNTAPCIAYASWRIKHNNPQANMVVTPSDHLVADTAKFKKVIEACLEFTSETDAIVTLGMNPTRPETGYGYIQADMSYSSPRNPYIFRVDAFHEKPDADTAMNYIKEKNFFWNAGIFIWNVHTIINAFRVYQPSMANLFESMNDVYSTGGEQARLDKLYPECENISVDYAIMEKVEEIFVCPANFGWSDIGTWGSLLLNTKRDIYGNSVIGENITIVDSSDCIVHTTQERRVIVQGLQGYIVAEKDHQLLICKLSEEQRIKEFPNK